RCSRRSAAARSPTVGSSDDDRTNRPTTVRRSSDNRPKHANSHRSLGWHHRCFVVRPEATMKTTTMILSLVSVLSLGFAGVAHAGEGNARKGQVNVQAAAAKAVIAGPAVVKVYS